MKNQVIFGVTIIFTGSKSSRNTVIESMKRFLIAEEIYLNPSSSDVKEYAKEAIEKGMSYFEVFKTDVYRGSFRFRPEIKNQCELM